MIENKDYTCFKLAMRELYKMNVLADLMHRYGLKMNRNSDFFDLFDKKYNTVIAKIADSLGFSIMKINVYHLADYDTTTSPTLLCWVRKNDDTLRISDELFSKYIYMFFDMKENEREVFIELLWKVFGEGTSAFIRSFLSDFSWKENSLD